MPLLSFQLPFDDPNYCGFISMREVEKSAANPSEHNWDVHGRMARSMHPFEWGHQVNRYEKDTAFLIQTRFRAAEAAFAIRCAQIDASLRARVSSALVNHLPCMANRTRRLEKLPGPKAMRLRLGHAPSSKDLREITLARAELAQARSVLAYEIHVCNRELAAKHPKWWPERLREYPSVHFLLQVLDLRKFTLDTFSVPKRGSSGAQPRTGYEMLCEGQTTALGRQLPGVAAAARRNFRPA